MVKGLLETIGLSSKADFATALLSHGEKRRLEIGIVSGSVTGFVVNG